MNGYRPLYNGSSTPCPGCGRTHWYVGRLSAQCAFCSTSIDLPQVQRVEGSATIMKGARNG